MSKTKLNEVAIAIGKPKKAMPEEQEPEAMNEEAEQEDSECCPHCGGELKSKGPSIAIHLGKAKK